MIAVEDDRRIIVEILFLDPADKLVHLAAGTRHRIGILISFKIIPAKITAVAILKVCIDREHGEIKGFLLFSKLQHLVFGVRKEFLVLVSPEDIVIRGDQTLLDSPLVVTDLVISVLRQIKSAAAEGGIRPHHEGLVIPLSVQDVPKCGNS